MATKARRSPGSQSPFVSGPFVGTFATPEPYDAEPSRAVDTVNCYVADPTSPSIYLGRPGFRILNGGSPVYSSGTAFRGQLVYSHTNLDASTVNFLVIGGRLIRADATLSVFTDVTPAGVTISGDITVRVFGTTLVGTLMFTDGVNRPWIATNLTATPITGSYIDYDSLGTAWSTYGAPKVYEGAAFAILNQVNGVSRRADVSWCNVGNFSTGWQQTDFDNNWTLSQNEAGNLYALESDNTALRYFRALSIGAASGTDVTSLASTATDDALAFNIGTQAPQSIQKFGTGFFFCDEQGRPYWYEPGTPPTPIWKQMRQFVDASTANFPTTTAIVCTAAIEPTLNLYVVAIWSPGPSTQSPPTELHVFDAQTRIYQGRWSIGPGIGIEAIGTLVDSADRATLVVLGSKLVGPAVGGYAWAFSALGSTPEDLATEGGMLLTTEGGVQLTTEGQAQIWTDDGTITQYVMTDRLGYSENVNLHVDTGTVITLSAGPVRVTALTSAQASAVQGTPSPSPSDDGTNRLTVGFDLMGRGPQVKVEPTTWDEQFALTRVSIKASISLAGPEDA